MDLRIVEEGVEEGAESSGRRTIAAIGAATSRIAPARS